MKTSQVGGDHYSKRSIEPIEFIERNKLPFAVGNIIKYLTRWRDKGGLEDLKKAKQYMSFMDAYSILIPSNNVISVEEYIGENKMGYEESEILRGIMSITPEKSEEERLQAYLSSEMILSHFIHRIEQMEAVNPDVVPELSNKREIGYGITVYDVDDTPEGQLAMRRIVDAHLGEDANPWLVLYGNGIGGVTDYAMDYWQQYNGCQKKVAFENGKLLAFCASEMELDVWRDVMDRPFIGIPLSSRPIPGDRLGRLAIIELDINGDIVEMSDIHKGNRQNDLYEEWNEEGQLLELSHWKEGLEDGLCEHWHDNGQLSDRCTYQEGQLNGLYECWHENGQLEERSHWKNGKREGLFESWHANGQLRERTNWRDDQKHGLYEYWHSNGQLRERSNWKDDQKHGLYERWHSNGQQWERSNWKDGRKDGLFEAWRKGCRVLRCHYQNDYMDGLLERWHDNGQLAERCHYQKGNKEGLEEFWSHNGKLLARHTYRNDMRDGLSEFLLDDGRVGTILYEMDRDVKHQTLDDFTPVKRTEASQEGKSLNFAPPKHGRSRGM
ncbi:DUF3310 domain-containing protein [Porphyromonas levii]|uniref:DUF3310 domain-containing protein n=1 Tax=Porphyromonas levii TaxID=28114 RepID=UPI001B8CAB25|nr:DUF3310 domain-containing protein [Porphyromonas levii]MBR8759010.1 hypothetical protein [Porphyromonas levii]MBR8801748.1 hypothetical protein [Porphyromonas levii]